MFGLEFLLMASSAIGVGSSLYEGFAGSRAGQLQAQVARQNTQLYQAQAGLEDTKQDLVFSRTRLEATRVRDAVRRVTGAQTAHFAANNLDPTSGSPLLLALATVEQGEADAALIEAQGLLEAAETRTRKASFMNAAAGSSFEEAAALDRAFSARMAGYFGAGTAMLSAATRWPGLMGGGGAASAAGAPMVINRYGVGTAGSPQPWRIG